MYQFKYRKITKILFCFLMFFSFELKTNAETYVTKSEKEENLYVHCNESYSCIPICIYSCENDKGDCSFATKYNNGDYAFYGHYYNEEYEEDNDGIKKVWSFEVLPSYKNTSTLYTWTNDKVPKVDGVFYFIPDTLFGFSKKWGTTTEYSDLSKKFSCPKYFQFGSEKSIVFSNSSKEGKKVLTYSFVDELEKVIQTATPQEIENFTGPINTKDLYSFMSKTAGYSEYNESLSEEQNAEKACNFLKEKIDNSDNNIEKIIKDFSNDENKIKEFIDEKLQATATNVRFKNVYTYDNLQSLLEGQKIVDSNNDSYLKRINDIYSTTERNTISYFNNKCNLGLSQDDMQNIQDQTSQTVMEKLESTTHKLTDIDFDNTEFDCDTLFGGEIAKIISGAYFIIELAALGILIIFTVIDYAKVILNGESDEIKKQNQKLMKRLIIVVVLFILPALVNTTLRLFHIEGFDSEHPLCIQISNK